MTPLSQLFCEGLFDSLLLLDIANNQINDTAFSSVCSAIMDNKTPLVLEELWIGGCPIMSTGIIMFASLISMGLLQNLKVLCADSGRWRWV